MKNDIQNVKAKLLEELSLVEDIKSLSDLKVEYMGKKGPITEFGKSMASLSIEEKKEIGQLLNSLKVEVNEVFDKKKVELEEKAYKEKLEKEKIDITLPGTKVEIGSLHPLTKVITEVEELFLSMGYDVLEGPEIESEVYNFERLNLPKDHPARDMQDSFYITEEFLLRTQTSPVQARTMESNKDKTPIRMISSGKTYRRDNDDATHSHQFSQIEGLVIDKDISIAHLKGTLEVLIKKLFGADREIRFRPSFFPFTEPSLEVDVTCFKCGGSGCSLCKETGWIEILGSGMVHPDVLRMGGYDPEVYSGFAFGMGPERIAMLKYGITDIRQIYTNDITFLDNFNRIEKED